MKADDTAVNLQPEDMTGGLGKGNGQGPQADPDFNDHILLADSTCLDYRLRSFAMHKKILAETLFRRQLVRLQRLFCLSVNGHYPE
jgi:hypothetical protein